MKQSRLRIGLVGLTVLALAAGVTAGLLAARLPIATEAPLPPPPGDRTALAEELGLSPEQREQMREIWEGVRKQVHDAYDDAQRLQGQRDDAMLALLNAEQKAQFESIAKDYADQFAALTKKREQAFKDALARTNKLLNDEQRKKYEQILRSHAPPGPAGGAGPGPSFGPAPVTSGPSN
jgi:Spy/CpxP family protein refolding chaperone